MSDPWNEQPDASEAAVHCEVVKLGMTQDKNGYVLKLSIHPDEVPESLMRDWVGSRYMLALAKLDDNDAPIVPKEKVEAEKVVKMAMALCRNPKFWKYIAFGSKDGAPKTEVECAAVLKEHLGIESRKELATNKQAREDFMSLANEFRDTIEEYK